MKHLLTFLLVGMIGLLSVNTTFSQVDDRAVVPVSVTLNSILRLNIESGGNVEFNFNTLDQYQTGITNSSQYDTKISVASSVDWNLKMGAEDGYLIQADSAGSGTNMPLDYVGYQIEATGSGSSYTIPSATASGGVQEPLQQLSTIADGSEQIQNNGGNAGGIGDNQFTVHWECGTGNGNMNGNNLLGSNLTGGRYSTNVFFILEAD
jgi:hypothetical protein